MFYMIMHEKCSGFGIMCMRRSWSALDSSGLWHHHIVATFCPHCLRHNRIIFMKSPKHTIILVATSLDLSFYLLICFYNLVFTG